MTSAADTVEFPTLCAEDVLAASSMCMQLSGIWAQTPAHEGLGWIRRLLDHLRGLQQRARRKWFATPGPSALGSFDEPSPSASSTLLSQLSYAAMIDVMLPPEGSPFARYREASAPVERAVSDGVPVVIAYDDTKPLVLE